MRGPNMNTVGNVMHVTLNGLALAWASVGRLVYRGRDGSQGNRDTGADIALNGSDRLALDGSGIR